MNTAFKREMNPEPINVVPANEEALWQAVVTRDSRFDGDFVFAVSSTRIYCRPSCPSRRPKRERVTFFNFPEAAEKAGYRACLRCRPGATTTGDQTIELVRRACELLEQSEEAMTLASLGSHLGISPFHLQRTFKRIVGITPRQYAETCRTNRFKKSVSEGQPITGAMYDAGYGSSSRLYERAGAELGMTPATYNRNGRGALIHFTVAKCDLGWVLVAATEQGVCAVRLGSVAEELEAGLRAEFSAARIERNDAELRQWVNQILDHLAGRKFNLDLPLDVQATAFQRLVWKSLKAIPYGSTRSYGEVAAAIGRPSAVRAVARACATNPVALVIPCHRVIRENGGLSGYRWGLERKRKLIEQETATNRDPGGGTVIPE